MPITPEVAIAIAAILDAHPKRLPHWHQWAVELRSWAETADCGLYELPAPLEAMQATIDAARARARADR